MGAVLVVTGGSRQARLERAPAHSHAEALLAWSDSATVVISCAERDWIIPPGHGMWIPADTVHAVEVLRSGAGSALVFDPGRCPIAWPRPAAVVTRPLVRELIRYLGRLDSASTDARGRAEAVLFDVLEPARPTAILLPVPSDDRLRKITDGLIANPADGRDLARWAYEVGAGVRTLTRLFVAQTGMTFGQWRTNARIRAAITLLAEGAAVGTVARRVGFAKPSAFTEAFRRVTGHVPAAFTPDDRGG